jgi:RNA polymerase sigma-70 factor (ECF subfamily)
VAIRHNGAALRELHTLFDVGTFAGLGDGQLLERFEARRGEGAELAFAALVERHGPMVLRVCRGVLRDAHAADDAFQATFLVLARRAGSVRKRESVGSWLHGVAYRVARCARAAEARRRAHERRAAEMAARAGGGEGPDDLGPVLHEEIGRLPDRYRAAVVLCDLEGSTYEEAARRLGWPVGTIKSRLARGRARLRARLARRGVAPAAGGAIGLAPAALRVPPALAEATVRVAMQGSTGHAAAAGAVPASVAALTDGVLKAMMLSKIKLALAATAVVALGGVATGWAQVAPGARPAGGEDARAAKADADDLVHKLRTLLAERGDEVPTQPGSKPFAQFYRELEQMVAMGPIELISNGDVNVTARLDDAGALRKARPLVVQMYLLGSIRVAGHPRMPDPENPADVAALRSFYEARKRLADVAKKAASSADPARRKAAGEDADRDKAALDSLDQALRLEWEKKSKDAFKAPPRSGQQQSDRDLADRLSDVERKLDRVLKALEAAKRDPEM